MRFLSVFGNHWLSNIHTISNIICSHVLIEVIYCWNPVGLKMSGMHIQHVYCFSWLQVVCSWFARRAMERKERRKKIGGFFCLWLVRKIKKGKKLLTLENISLLFWRITEIIFYHLESCYMYHFFNCQCRLFFMKNAMPFLKFDWSFATNDDYYQD